MGLFLFNLGLSLLYSRLIWSQKRRYFGSKSFLFWVATYSRLKKLGLPNRYRLFFKIFPQQKAIIILWLGFPRKEGDKKDCYRVFTKMVEKGQFPLSLKDLINLDNGQES